MIKTIAEHSFDVSLLKQGSKILDLGCSGMEFSNHFKYYHDVYSVDLYDAPFQVAIAGYNGQCGIIKTDDPQANRITKEGKGIVCMTLKTFSKSVLVDFWDLIKMDIEGSEFDVIMSMDKPMAKQLSIEFHLHTNIYGIFDMRLMEDKLKALGYIAVQHELTDRHCAGLNYWDSLFIMK